MGYRIIVPSLIAATRGDRTLEEIAKNSNGKFKKAELSAWENGYWKPGEGKIPHLLEALGCDFEDISLPYDQAQELKIKNFQQSV